MKELFWLYKYTDNSRSLEFKILCVLLVHTPTAEPSLPHTLLFSTALSWAVTSLHCKFLVDADPSALHGQQTWSLLRLEICDHINGRALLGCWQKMCLPQGCSTHGMTTSADYLVDLGAIVCLRRSIQKSREAGGPQSQGVGCMHWAAWGEGWRKGKVWGHPMQRLV